MAIDTKIAWARSTFNPWIGCTEVSPGCDNCYARVLDSRKRWGGVTHWGVGVPRHRTSISSWAPVRRWERLAEEEQATGVLAPRSRWHGPVGYWPVFCGSLCDILDNEVPVEWAMALWELIRQTPHLSWLLVTKRIGVGRVRFPQEWLRDGFPANVRVLISVVNQEEANRDIPKLLALPCKNGISYEPALGPVKRAAYVVSKSSGVRSIEWIIVGGESDQGGARARPFDLEWAFDVLQQTRLTGTPAFIKQLGSRVVFGAGDRPEIRGVYRDRAGADASEWPVDLQVREFPFGVHPSGV